MLREFKKVNGNIVRYDDTLYTEFELYDSKYLRYIGPQDVIPVIPDSVIFCSSMFVGCTSLTQAPVIPDSVINCAYMFEGCTSLRSSTLEEPAVNCELSSTTLFKLINRAAEKGITAKELQEYISNYKSCITSNMDAYNLSPDEQALAVFDLYF